MWNTDNYPILRTPYDVICVLTLSLIPSAVALLLVGLVQTGVCGFSILRARFRDMITLTPVASSPELKPSQQDAQSSVYGNKRGRSVPLRKRPKPRAILSDIPAPQRLLARFSGSPHTCFVSLYNENQVQWHGIQEIGVCDRSFLTERHRADVDAGRHYDRALQGAERATIPLPRVYAIDPSIFFLPRLDLGSRDHHPECDISSLSLGK
ncbi:hypothetical protein FALCPG4_007230 [Fusarium falciforme]